MKIELKKDNPLISTIAGTFVGGVDALNITTESSRLSAIGVTENLIVTGLATSGAVFFGLDAIHHVKEAYKALKDQDKMTFIEEALLVIAEATAAGGLVGLAARNLINIDNPWLVGAAVGAGVGVAAVGIVSLARIISRSSFLGYRATGQVPASKLAITESQVRA